jgi:hypothetical protein
MPLLLAAAEDSRGDVARQRLGRCLTEFEVLDLERGLGYRQAGMAHRVRCVAASAQHAAPYMLNLKSLDLSETDLKGDDLAALAQHAARHWPQLHTLKLKGNRLQADGMRALAGAAQHWPQPGRQAADAGPCDQ